VGPSGGGVCSRDRQESGRRKAKLTLKNFQKVSNIEQRQQFESRILFSFASRSQPLASVVALAWVHQGSKTGIGVPDFRLFGAILVDVAE